MTKGIFPENTKFALRSSADYSDYMPSYHFHDFYEIYYVVSGSCNYFIDNQLYEVLEGDIVLIPSGVIHKTNYKSPLHKRILIECSDNMVPERVRESFSSMIYLYRGTHMNKDFYSIFKRLEKEYSNHDQYSREMIQSTMNMIFCTLARSKSIVKVSQKRNKIIEEIVSQIKENFNQPISLSEVAREKFISQEHLSRTFKKHTGFGFNEYITLIRLQHAERLLRSKKKLSISEIAYSCGFNDSNYFSDKFKKIYGTSPLKYSKAHKN